MAVLYGHILNPPLRQVTLRPPRDNRAAGEVVTPCREGDVFVDGVDVLCGKLK